MEERCLRGLGTGGAETDGELGRARFPGGPGDSKVGLFCGEGTAHDNRDACVGEVGVMRPGIDPFAYVAGHSDDPGLAPITCRGIDRAPKIESIDGASSTRFIEIDARVIALGSVFGTPGEGASSSFAESGPAPFRRGRQPAVLPPRVGEGIPPVDQNDRPIHVDGLALKGGTLFRRAVESAPLLGLMAVL